MKELVETIAKALVDNPDEVQVTEVPGDGILEVKLKVAQGDMGRVIGRSGKIAKAIRAIVKAASSKDERKVFVDIE